MLKSGTGTLLQVKVLDEHLRQHYVQAHYNLGLAYEDVGDFEEVGVQYRFATQDKRIQELEAKLGALAE